jgi:arylsulfatase A-like enzyme
VSIDSLRSDHLGAYGYPRPTSPTIDALAAAGLRYEGARASSPWTLPSHMTMLTGLWPTDHHVVEDDIALAPTVPLVQEALQAAGWATAGFVSTIYVSHTYGFARGFDTFRDYGITERDNLAHPIRANQVVDDALAWVKEHGAGEPVFLFLHLYDVHYPYMPPPPFDTKFDRAGSLTEARYRSYKFFLAHPIGKRRMQHLVAEYDESIAWVDSQLARLTEAWSTSDRPVRFVVTADHGEELGERGSWGHAHTLYREALEVPLIVSGAGVTPAVRHEQVGTVDIAATVAGLAGVPWTQGPGVDVRGNVPTRTFLAETSRFDSARLSILEGGHRLDLDLAGQARALYDIGADHAETRDLAPDDVAGADALERRLWETLPTEWEADAGTVRTVGQLWTGGARVGQALAAPARFGVYPPDAEVYLDASPPVKGVLAAPPSGPLRYTGRRTAVPVTLDDATRAQLEALGYVQTPDETETPAETPDEPAGGTPGSTPGR